ncbi:MAG: alpha-L-fucosidase [Pseudopedobacter saltans]|uniref:alpha-L-fucosidase n=1 Tax=Pseudopedobacter saltans TaxID=151895 RepID=A0A2W5F595_9SPHI|nr:MAG: alpha-L-fucosidase [Pseudopedobacter saltans]
MFYIVRILLILGTLIAFCDRSNAQNFVSILPTDNERLIIEKAAHVTPSERQLRWQQLELTAFMHFGINTFTNKEWGDGTDDISIFNPKMLNAEQWVNALKNAGFKQIIFTAKHHDGFCLWPTKYTKYAIQNTPYKDGKGDIVKEISTACKKNGIGFGIYLSPWDRNSKYYGDSIQYNTYFENQLTELLTNYGTIDEVWFDGANGEGPDGKKQWYDFQTWYALIRRLQPQAIIANMGPDVRWVGTESGIGRITEWSVLPLTESSQVAIAKNSQKDMTIKPTITGSYKDNDRGGRGKLSGVTGLIWYPAETDVSIRPGWFYHPNEDNKVKTGKELLSLYCTSTGRNGLLLLNLPPNKDGLLSSADLQSLKDFGNYYKETFAINLAKKGTISISNKKSIIKLIDENRKTFVTSSNKSDSMLNITETFEDYIDFNTIVLQEAIELGQRVEKFKIEAMLDKKWSKIAEGTTIGYKRILQLNKSVKTKKLKINILSSRLNPNISEFGLYFNKYQ